MNDDELDFESELGFEPAISATGNAGTGDTKRARKAKDKAEAKARARSAKAAKAAKAATTVEAAPKSRTRRPRTTRPPRRRGGVRRKVGASVVLLAALGAMGGAYGMLAGGSNAAGTGMSSADVRAGQQLYQVSCITCHGANLEGIKDQGPPIAGVGAAAVYFQVSTGRMPAPAQGAYNDRKPPKFTEKEMEQLAAYVQSVGGGPTLPEGTLRGSDTSIAQGGDLFRLNCASCHGMTAKGAPLSAGKIAPSLNESTDKEIYAAMLTGPESMPVFNNNQLTPHQKRAIVAYVQTLKASQDPGGAGIDRIGPVSEAIVIWVAGVGALMITILWIGAKTR